MKEAYGKPLLGRQSQIQAFLNAAEAKTLHHAWLLSGPKGIGKAHFAWQASATLLAGGDWQQAQSSSTSAHMLAGSHPDFRWIEPDPTKAKAQITIEQIRTMAGMFLTTAGMGGWRIAVIDAADDMNRNAANAILKLLEEPPEKSLFFLISHAAGRLLPTIRSRCSILRFESLSMPDTAAILGVLAPDTEAIERDAVLPLAHGSPGRAADLLSGNAADYLLTLEDIFSALPQLDEAAVLGLADTFGDRAATPAFSILWELIEERIAFAAKAAARGDHGEHWVRSIDVADWIALQEGLAQRKAQTIGLNLSPRQVVLNLFFDIGRMANTSNATA
ncbi:MAG: DNA polymerase III subunit delta' [Pseudomonadota bacterium]